MTRKTHFNRSTDQFLESEISDYTFVARSNTPKMKLQSLHGKKNTLSMPVGWQGEVIINNLQFVPFYAHHQVFFFLAKMGFSQKVICNHKRIWLKHKSGGALKALKFPIRPSPKLKTFLDLPKFYCFTRGHEKTVKNKIL